MADSGTPLSGITIKAPVSAIGPLREPLFRALWLAAVVSYTGAWMQNVGTGWLMASLTNSPVMVGLVQAAIAAPVFLVSIFAGALADMMDRRRLLLLTQSWMVLAALSLGLLTHFGMITPMLLLIFTFLMGLGNVMNDPAWQAITHEIVSDENFPSAVALNSAGFNVARAVGPAIGGIVIAVWGAAAVFLLNAASFFGVILVLYGWKRRPHEYPVPASSVKAAIRAGFSFALQSKGMQSVLIRTAVFSVSASALWAMLPLIAQCYGSIGFGTMVAAFGLGALLGAGLLPQLRRSFTVNTIVGAATLMYAAATAATGYIHEFNSHCTLMVIGGAGWIIIVASLNVSAQLCSPTWLKARTLSMYLIVLQGGMALGSTFWGTLAERISINTSLSVAGIALVLGLLVSRNHRLGADQQEMPHAPVVS
ncbi:MAG TPA: MFS transporter [Terriglobales bacterium]|nr:MFS transporter [Terriglobales bacterium]